MPATLFVVHGSHPCATVARALELKGIPFRRVELPPSLHPPVQKLLFGRRTVPGVVLEGGERIAGSRAILRRLDELVAEPALVPPGAVGEAVLEAEAWGDDVLQPLVRRVLWWALAAAPTAIPSYQEHAAAPLPGVVVPFVTPLVVALERRMNHVTDAGVRADLADLPGHLDRVDRWLADGTLGGDGAPNAADLQIASGLRLLCTIEDLAGPIAARPAGRLTRRVFPDADGHVPAGTLPDRWIAGLRAEPGAGDRRGTRQRRGGRRERDREGAART